MSSQWGADAKNMHDNGDFVATDVGWTRDECSKGPDAETESVKSCASGVFAGDKCLQETTLL